MQKIRDIYRGKPKGGWPEVKLPDNRDSGDDEPPGCYMGIDYEPNVIFRQTTQQFQTRKGKSVQDQLANLEFELNNEVLSDQYTYSSWDTAQGGLKLQYEARCFCW